MKKLLFLYWDSCFCCTDFLEAIADHYEENNDIQVRIVDIQDPDLMDRDVLISTIETNISSFKADSLFSFGFFPVISQECQKIGILYLSWVFDSPVVNLYHRSARNDVNRIFLFDSNMVDELLQLGYLHVYYLPMAVNPRRLEQFIPRDEEQRKYSAEVSFVGSLYSDKNSFYDDMVSRLSDHSHGYLDGLLNAQSLIYGYSFLQKCLPQDILNEMTEKYPLPLTERGEESTEWLYSEYVLARKLTSIERKEIISGLGRIIPFRLYTTEKDFMCVGVENCGEVDYFNEMPYVFKCSKINLNITLRSIQKGIPLRVFDIMGCGGFLLTDYREDMLALFTPGEDYIYWEDKEQIPELVQYYLSHDDERRSIAENGKNTVIKFHTFRHRFEKMLQIIQSDV